MIIWRVVRSADRRNYRLCQEKPMSEYISASVSVDLGEEMFNFQIEMRF